MKIMFVTDQHFTSMRLSCRKDDFPETMLNKMQRVFELAVQEKVDLVVHGGDIYHTGRISKAFENRLLALFKAYPLKHAAVIGNHDIRYAQPDTVSRLPLGTLFASRIFQPQPPDFVYETDDTMLVLVPFHISPEPFSIKTKKCVVVAAHYFYQSGFQKGTENLPESLCNEADFILLGHDHTPYPIQRVGRAQIVRPGALSRGTRHEINWKRPVQVALVDTVTGVASYVAIPVAPAEDVFRKERIVSDGVGDDESKLLDDLMVSMTAEENVPALLGTMVMPQPVRSRVEFWLREYAII